jgi:hypothetical protein
VYVYVCFSTAFPIAAVSGSPPPPLLGLCFLEEWRGSLADPKFLWAFSSAEKHNQTYNLHIKLTYFHCASKFFQAIIKQLDLKANP